MGFVFPFYVSDGFSFRSLFTSRLCSGARAFVSSSPRARGPAAGVGGARGGPARARARGSWYRPGEGARVLALPGRGCEGSGFTRSCVRAPSESAPRAAAELRLCRKREPNRCRGRERREQVEAPAGALPAGSSLVLAWPRGTQRAQTCSSHGGRRPTLTETQEPAGHRARTTQTPTELPASLTANSRAQAHPAHTDNHTHNKYHTHTQPQTTHIQNTHRVWTYT